MNEYRRETEEYNPRRYSRPWIARVVFEGGKPSYNFGDWVGEHGEEGVLIIKNIKVGDIIAIGQKDTRNRNNTSLSYFIYSGESNNKDMREVSKLEAFKHFEETHKKD